MARPGSFSIDLVNVDGIYEAKQNAAEAQRICEEAIDLMGKLANASKEDFGTIGVVAVNSDQRDRILEEFRRLSAGNAAVERFMERAAEQGEPFIVKNLENIQGDERDFIMISLTYGRLAGKKTVNQTFGPINRSQGHRLSFCPKETTAPATALSFSSARRPSINDLSIFSRVTGTGALNVCGCAAYRNTRRG
jgi:superfamily I DNA and/or RNA helicase